MAKDDDMFSHDWYAVLHLGYDATEDEIATAGRKLSAKYHPDKNKSVDAPEKFLLIQKAKNILSDAAKRKEIDEKRTNIEKRKAYESKRDKEMDASRKRRRDELEKKVREEAAHAAEQPAYTQSDVDAIRKQSALRREEANQRATDADNERMNHLRELMQQKTDAKSDSVLFSEEQLPEAYRQGIIPTQLKLKWKTSRHNHSDDSIFVLLRQRGISSIEDVSLVSDSSKGNAAIITLSDPREAVRAMNLFSNEADYRLSVISPPDDNSRSQRKAVVFTHVFSGTNGSSTVGGNAFFNAEVNRAVELDSLRSHEASTSGTQNFDSVGGSCTVAALAAKEDDVFALAAMKKAKKLAQQQQQQQRQECLQSQQQEQIGDSSSS